MLCYQKGLNSIYQFCLELKQQLLNTIRSTSVIEVFWSTNKQNIL